MKSFIIFLVFISALFFGGYKVYQKKHPEIGEFLVKNIMQISSPTIPNNGTIPGVHTCQGSGVSPELNIFSAHEDAKTLALIVDDPDAASGTFTHWVVYNIPSSLKKIPAGSNSFGITARNSLNTNVYVPLCPPSGKHKYIFTVYALDFSLPNGGIIGKKDLVTAMTGHILDQAHLTGWFQKK